MDRYLANFFEDPCLSLCLIYNLSNTDISYYNTFKKGTLSLNKFIKKFSIDLNTRLDEYYIVCKHGITSIDNFNYFNKKGIKNLKYLLSHKRSPLYRFLLNNNIFFLIKEKQISIDNILYNISEFPELYSKLYFYKGEIEVFLSGTVKEINSYSDIKNNPEIIDTICHILEQLNIEKNIKDQWKEKSIYKIITFKIKFKYLYKKRTNRALNLKLLKLFLGNEKYGVIRFCHEKDIIIL